MLEPGIGDGERIPVERFSFDLGRKTASIVPSRCSTAAKAGADAAKRNALLCRLCAGPLIRANRIRLAARTGNGSEARAHRRTAGWRQPVPQRSRQPAGQSCNRGQSEPIGWRYDVGWIDIHRGTPAPFLAPAPPLARREAGSPSPRAVIQRIDNRDTAPDPAGSGFRLHAGLKAALAQGTVPAFLDEYRSSLHRTASQLVRFARDYSFAQQAAGFAAALVAAILLFAGVRVLLASIPGSRREPDPVRSDERPGTEPAEQRVALRRVGAGLRGCRAAARSGSTAVFLPRSNENRSTGMRSPSPMPGSNIFAASAWQRCLSSSDGEDGWGLSGASGAGKTTLIDLVAGLLTPESGHVKMVASPSMAHAGSLASRPRLFGQEGNGLQRQRPRQSDRRRRDGRRRACGWRSKSSAWPSGFANLRRPRRIVGDRGSHLSGGEASGWCLPARPPREPSPADPRRGHRGSRCCGEAEVSVGFSAIEPRPAALVVAHRDSTSALRFGDRDPTFAYRNRQGSPGLEVSSIAAKDCCCRRGRCRRLRGDRGRRAGAGSPYSERLEL